MPLTIRKAAPDEILDLRWHTLRPGLPRDTASFPGDDAPTSHHWAALDDAGHVLGCLTLHQSTWENQPAYQLRGMATAPHLRRTGLGTQLLAAAETFVLSTPIRLLWCNARLPAIGFYHRAGWHTVSEEFDIPTAGPHVRMLKRLPTQSKIKN